MPNAWRYGQPTISAITDVDDFDRGGYCPDAALASESDPAAMFSEVADRGEWLVTRDAAPTVAIADGEPGSWLSVTTGASADDFVSAQKNGSIWTPAAGRRIIIDARIKIDDTDDTKWFIGLAVPDVTGTTLGPILDGVTDSVGFRILTGTDANIQYVTEASSTETTGDTGYDLVDDTAINLQAIILGTERVLFFVNGVNVFEATTNIPTAALTKTFEVSSTTASSNLKIDYLNVVGDRP